MSVALVGALASPISAQPTTGAAGRTLLATVVDARGRTVVDLEADDFVISENGRPREILDLHVADYPVAVLIDDQQSAAAALPAIKAAAGRFISRIGQRPVAVVALTRPDELVATFDDERTDVLARLDDIATNTSSDAMPLQALAQAVRLLSQTGAVFSAVVVISAAPIDASQPVQGDLLPGVVESGTAVHVIANRSAEANEVGRPQESDLLRLLAEQTHGQYTAIFTTASYAVALDRLADRLSSEMMVEFLVPPDAPAGEVRAGVRIPGARVIGLGVK